MFNVCTTDASIFFTAATIRAFRSARSCGNGGTNTLCVLCTKCTLHNNHRLTRVIFQHTNDFSPGAAVFSLHTLASPSGRNMNYDKKNNVLGEKIQPLLLSVQVS